jgi:rSAM/selenodomain-associated transferase 2
MPLPTGLSAPVYPVFDERTSSVIIRDILYNKVSPCNRWVTSLKSLSTTTRDLRTSFSWGGGGEKTLKISVIIPALNEAERIEEAIRGVDGAHEVIVADGGSIDGTGEAAERGGARVVRTGPGRGAQCDAGAGAATGEVLLFLHADTELPPGWRSSVEKALKDSRTVGGGFALSIGSRQWRYRVVETLANIRARRLKLIYGDQGIFARRDAFIKAGGFRKLPLMEDVDCVKRLRRAGDVVLLDERVVTSPRRWSGRGVLLVTLKNWLILTLYHLGVPPERLYNWYYA